jgi:hypothetical protein
MMAHVEPDRGHRVAADDPETIAAGFRAVFRIFDAWHVSADQAMTLLGRPARSTFYKWRRGEVGATSHDTISRVSYILGIHKALQILYRDPQLADSWIKRPNVAFAQRSALDRMSGGDIADLAAVRDHLDAARGGWF